MLLFDLPLILCAQVSGFEYLDKIVQIPFAIPPLVDLEKSALCRGYLTGSRCG